MKASSRSGFEWSSQGKLFQSSSPLDTLVRRTSSRRQPPKQPIQASQANASNAHPSLRPYDAHPQPSAYYAVSPLRPFASQGVPDSPLLHSNFRDSTASAATNITALRASQSSKPFISFTDDREPDNSGCYEDNNSGQQPQPSSSHNYYDYDNHHTAASTSTRLGPPTDLWPQATGLTQPGNLNCTDPQGLMHPLPSPLPTVIVSSPQDDDPRLSSPMRQPIVSQSSSPPRLNFSRPGRPLILSSEERKRRVLERNTRRANSPIMSPSPVPFGPVTSVTGGYLDNHPINGHLASSELSGSSPASSSYLRPNGAHSTPSLASPSQITLPSHPPSLRAGSALSLYSNSYSYYQLDSGAPSPSPTSSHSPRSSADLSPAASRPVSTEPQTPEEYLQLGIQFHEANQLKDSAIYFEKSARDQGGCSVGMLMWGLTLRHGWGCERDEQSGFKWLTKAAELAVEDLEKAKMGLDVRSVREELVIAIYEVGQCFFHGWGVAKDQKMAVSYYRVAAKLGDADAQQDLAFCLVNGKGCKKDKIEAAKWYRAAVAQGASDVGMAWIYKDKYKD